MDDSGFKATRLSLMIISIGIIIFILGGGTIDKANIFFGSIDLKDDAPVRWAVVLIYIYMLWRYWLYKDEVIGNFGKEFKKYFYSSDDYVNIAVKIAETSNYGTTTTLQMAIRSYKWKVLLPFQSHDMKTKDIKDNKITSYHYPLLLNNHFYPEFLYARLYVTAGSLSSFNELNLPDNYSRKTVEEKFEISTLQFQLLELIVLSKMIFAKRTFADFLLPIPIALWAGYLLIA